MINKERLLNTFLDYVRIDSESRNEKAMAQRVIADLKHTERSIFTVSVIPRISGIPTTIPSLNLWQMLQAALLISLKETQLTSML